MKDKARREKEEQDRLEREEAERERREKEGGSGVVTFIIILLILGITAGVAYYLFKRRDEKSPGQAFAFTGSQSNIDPDGLAADLKI